jgi:hypothetical protein
MSKRITFKTDGVERILITADGREYWDLSENGNDISGMLNRKNDLIEQAEKQEPVGEIVKAFSDLYAVHIPVMPPVGTKLYTSPPQREWVGLTDEEITELFCNYDGSQFPAFARAIQAKLKEKNAYGWQSVSNPTEYLDELRGGTDT